MDFAPYASPDTINFQAVRAILLASATAASFGGLRLMIPYLSAMKRSIGLYILLIVAKNSFGNPPLFSTGPHADHPDCLVEQAVDACMDATLREAETLLL